MADQSFDIIVIGTGPGGYVDGDPRRASSGSRRRSWSATTWAASALNWGCIPTKALLRSAEIFHYLQHAKDYGLSAEKVGFDAKADRRALAQGRRAAQQRRRLPDEEEQDRGDLGRGHRSTRPARSRSRHRRAEAPKGALRPGTYQAKHIIVATGARPRVLPGIEPDKKLVWTYFEAMVPDGVPKSLLVIGSGAIGIEFASFFRTLGSEVTVVEVLPQILPVEDAEIAAFARKAFEKQGMKILTGAKVTKLEKRRRRRHRHHRRRQGRHADAQRGARDLGRGRGRQHREPRAWRSSA